MYKCIFKNAYKIIKNDESYLAIRFTEKQLEYYKNKSAAAEDRSRDTAGICMDFYTDAEEISFAYKACCFSRRYVGFDFYEDGIFRKHIEEALDTKQSVITHPLEKKGYKRVTVYIPNLSEITMYDLNIGNFKPIEENSEKKLLFLGDSITQGMVAQSPSLAFTTQLARAWKAESLNRGVGGARFEADSLDDEDEYNPTHIFTAYGINDIYHLECVDELPAVLNQADIYLQKLKKIYNDALVYVITPIWCLRYDEDKYFAKIFDEYTGKLMKIVEKYGFTVVNGMNLVPHDTKYFQDHSVHPADSGFNHYAENLIKAIE